MTFTFKQVDCDVVFHMVSILSGVSVMPGPDIKGAFDLSFEKVPWPRVVDDLAARAGWVAVCNGEKEFPIRAKADFEKARKRRRFLLRISVWKTRSRVARASWRSSCGPSNRN